MAAQALLITVTHRRTANLTERWRWRAGATNHRRLSRSSEGYRDLAGLVHALRLHWPPGADEHVLVKLPDRPPVSLAALDAA